MIKPKKSKSFQYVMGSYLVYLLRKHFYRIWIDDQRKGGKDGRGNLILVNHSSWWDGLLVFYLNHRMLKEDSYAMMSQKGMEEFSFFRKLGAFSVNPASPKDLVTSLKFAEARLKEKKTVWIFPQGKEEHLEKRPISFMSGPSFLYERNPEIKLTTVCFYYTFCHDQRPEIFIRICEEAEAAESQSRKDRTDTFRRLMEKRLDTLKRDIIEGNLSAFSLHLKGFPTSSEWLSFWTRKG
ncbi:lysophospholipid acyltransferase family protein [Bacillus sp. KH172YL63]|uniref:lysophospholipid acyltransferase family protein n=1 Tax=Bacillus sp. KH172YL63 TaxID=2709784 RepID=UPI0013E4C6E9|nr:lysophospholipid acyltransferase family protein [Bacillus sp. KH172YL63]BCB04385.1 glycerol acyltransferase [Bacillus sp. KH172YL63]